MSRSAGKSSPRERKNHRRIGGVIAGGVLFGIFMIAGILFYIKRYAPTSEHMDLAEYYQLDSTEEAVVIINGVYIRTEDENAYGLIRDGAVYLALDVVKEQLDNGYVFDAIGGILRYATDDSVITANVDGKEYTQDKETLSADAAVVILAEDRPYVLADFLCAYTDMQYQIYEEAPARVVVEAAGYEKTAGTLRSDAAIRRLGGPKSKILKDAARGDTVTVLDTIGKWTNVLTEDGIIGYVKSSRIKDKTTVTTEATLEARTYNHIQMNEAVCLGWHQVTNTTANATLTDVLATATGINVISPTWFYMNDNNGGIASHAAADYVASAHASGIQVWGLVSNFEDDVDTALILNTTASRDALVNNLVGAAIATGLDGINVDIELLPQEAADGYAAFIRELSIKCEKNDLVLSVDVGVPTSWNGYYDRENLANYCDYVIVMAYDEHYGGDEEPGSTASLPWVRDGVSATLEEVPAEQVVLGCPFYSRIWQEKDAAVTSTAIYMSDIADYLSEHDLTAVWSEDDEQSYAEYTDADVKYMLWLEDATSMGERMTVMQENKLAGCAFWKLGMEPASVWTVIEQYAD